MHNKTSGTITRRDFLRGGTAGVAGTALGISAMAHAYGQAGEGAAADKSRVVLVRNANSISGPGTLDAAIVEQMLDKAVCSLLDESSKAPAWGKLFSSDDVVGIKVTLMMTTPRQELMTAIVNGLRSAGLPDKNIFFFDRGHEWADLEELKGRGTRLEYEPTGYCTVVTQKATKLINVPGMKTHGLSGIGVAVKNWVGALGAHVLPISRNKDALFADIHKSACADLGRIIANSPIKDKCVLNVVDAFEPIFGGGPQFDPRHRWAYNGLLVSRDPVAVDIVCGKVIQAKRDEFKGEPWKIAPPLRHLVVADKEYGLGQSDPDKIELIKLGDTDGMLV